MEPSIYIESLFLKLIAERNAELSSFSNMSKLEQPEGDSSEFLLKLDQHLDILSQFDHKIKILVAMFPDLPKLLNLEEIRKKQEESEEDKIAKANPDYGKAEVLHKSASEEASDEKEIKS